MLVLESSVLVEGISAQEVTDFLLHPSDDRYRAWWPGTHLQFHVVDAANAPVGDVVRMDEYVGRRRLRLSAVVVEAEPGRRIVWRFGRRVHLPARLRLELTDGTGGCLVRHTLEAGFGGFGRVLDPFLRLYLSPRFAVDLDRHVRTEFPKLRDLIHGHADRRTRSRSAPYS
jgi:polyketide cyclase/dehydrase/lipid transport protein